MSGLFSSLGLGIRGLQVTSLALQTAGHNISNANTEGYSRQRVDVTASLPHQELYGSVGTGTEISGIQRLVDEFIEMRLREESSELESLNVKESAFAAVEAIFNELGDTDLSTSLHDFFKALDDLAADSGSATVRRQLVHRAKGLSEHFRSMEEGLNGLRTSLDRDLQTSVNRVNNLITDIAVLNKTIILSEKDGTFLNNANDLHDQRGKLMQDLAELIEYTSFEQKNSQVNISVGGQFLVFGQDVYTLETSQSEDRNNVVSTVVFEATQKPVTLRGGRLEGIVTSRDTHVGGLLDDLNDLSAAVIFELNKAHSQGVGLTGFTSLTGSYQVGDATKALDQANLDFTPQNGAFEIHVRNENTGAVTTFLIEVDLDGIGVDTPLTDPTGGTGLVQLINAEVAAVFPEITASATATNRLMIESSSSDITFGFGNDTSHILAALGMNTIFTGTDAHSMGVNSVMVNDPGKIAAGERFVPGDNTNVLSMSGVRADSVKIGAKTDTLEGFYQGMVGALGVDSASVQDLHSVQSVLVEATEAQRLSVSGVSLDEEAVDLMTHQRIFQGLARYVNVIDELLEVLINAT